MTEQPTDETERCPECREDMEPMDVRKRLKRGRISYQRRCPNCDAFIGAGKKTFYNGEEFVTETVGEQSSTATEQGGDDA
ncbi:hypothetical protein [Halorussus pelagicus]|uniref:hypothetical protein n=1 Tax=Halorussus pelagicus TaxID=2505977 RepID=UPI000FFB4750|nr:hypothetical protein [Halorussus pelagicus]